MSLQERSLVVRNFDPERTTVKLLHELCMQAGPVKNVVLRSDHAFVEYEDVESVGYAKALLNGIELFGMRLVMESKVKGPTSNYYSSLLHDYIQYDRQQRVELQQHQQAISHDTRPHQSNYSTPFVDPNLLRFDLPHQIASQDPYQQGVENPFQYDYQNNHTRRSRNYDRHGYNQGNSHRRNNSAWGGKRR